MLIENNDIIIKNVCLIIRLLNDDCIIFLILDYNEIMLYDPLKYLNPILEECNEDIRSTIIFTKSFLF